MTYWDWKSFFLYMFLSISVVFLTYLAQRTSTTVQRGNIYSRICYRALFTLLVFFAAFRVVGGIVSVGTDASAYVELFRNSSSYTFDWSRFIRMKQNEPLFYIMATIVRSFTDSYTIFFIIYYGIIVSCYLKFIAKQYKKGLCLAPLLYVIIIYLASFNTMRSAMGVAFGLLAYNALVEKKDIKAICMIIIGMLFHISSAILLVFYVFYKIFSTKAFGKRKWAIIVIGCAYLVFYVGSDIIRGILSGTKYYVYLDQRNSLIGQLIIIICGILTIIYFEDLNKLMHKQEALLWAVIFNVAMLPLVTNFGFFRLNEFFIFPRLVVWAYIVKVVSSRITVKIGDIVINNIIVYVLALTWTIFRITRAYESSGLMPYLNVLFN